MESQMRKQELRLLMFIVISAIMASSKLNMPNSIKYQAKGMS
jgi:hypothetical protein